MKPHPIDNNFGWMLSVKLFFGNLTVMGRLYISYILLKKKPEI